MDSIIGLLFLILPVLFSLVGKKLETAAKNGSEGVPQGQPHEEDDAPELTEVFPAIKKCVFEDEAPAPKPQKVVKPFKTKEKVEPHKRETIDPKKLVIYSEIMKPKYLE